jgi:hypothetical protein
MTHFGISGGFDTEHPPRANLLFSRRGEVVYIKERNFNMLKKDLILRNPLRLMGHETDDILSPGGFGAILARAGVGKTALLVQLALNSLLRDRNVLHISLGDPVKKVCLWYEEVFRNIATHYKVSQMDQLWEAILPYRFIMTFNVEDFSVTKLEERIADLTEQDIFMPQMVLIDGYPFEGAVSEPLAELKALTRTNSYRTWFAVRTHRHENPAPDGFAPVFSPVESLFEVALQLQPQDNGIYIQALKGGNAGDKAPRLFLDPATMLIQDAA